VRADEEGVGSDGVFSSDFIGYSLLSYAVLPRPTKECTKMSKVSSMTFKYSYLEGWCFKACTWTSMTKEHRDLSNPCY
jgi:hypothetical protein